ncbi:MAG: hypothetical protein K9G62_06335 [Alphaproteobacteria bacterium]|nr:hypothetical protein [Alphaproteobacteria bacterium]
MNTTPPDTEPKKPAEPPLPPVWSLVEVLRESLSPAEGESFDDMLLRQARTLDTAFRRFLFDAESTWINPYLKERGYRYNQEQYLLALKMQGQCRAAIDSARRLKTAAAKESQK